MLSAILGVRMGLGKNASLSIYDKFSSASGTKHEYVGSCGNQCGKVTA